MVRKQMPDNFRAVVIGIVKDGEKTDEVQCQGILGGELPLAAVAIEALESNLKKAVLADINRMLTGERETKQ